jgi:hypothetical protein
MTRILLTSLLFVSLAAGLTSESAGAPPSGLNPEIAGMLQKDGVKVMDGQKVVAEYWFRSALPSGPKLNENAVTLPTIPHGSLLGVVRYPERGSDRRGQTIKPGTYTLRFSFYPQNGDHQGVETQRDFLLLTPAAEDKEPGSTPDFESLMNMSRKASGTPHPAVLSMWKVESDFKPGVAQQGESDWVMQTKIGEVPIAVIVAGQSAH